MRLLVFGLAVAPVPATAATAFSEAQVWADLLATMDDNGDGWVSREEYAARGQERHFSDLDRSQDGRIDAEELAEWVRLTPPRPEQSALLARESGAAPDAPSAVPPPKPPPIPATAPGARSTPSGTPARPPTEARSEPGSPGLKMAAIGGLVGGLLTLGVGLWVRTRGGGRRRRRR